MSRILMAAAVALGLAGAAAPAIAQDAQLQEAQGVLMRMGMFKGRPTGQPDARTADALRQFQQKSNLPATGQLDGATLAALRKANDTQFSRTLGAPAPAFGPGGASNSLPAEPPKPRAAGPVTAVQSNDLAPPPGGRVAPTYLPAPGGANSAAGVRSELSPPGQGQNQAAGRQGAGAQDDAPAPSAAPRLGGPIQSQSLAGSVGGPPLAGAGAAEDDGEPKGAARIIPYVLAAAAVGLFGFVGWLWAGPRLRLRRDNPLIAGNAAILDDGRRREPKF